MTAAVESDVPASEVIDYASTEFENGIDLVAGNKERTGLDRFVVGSVRKSPGVFEPVSTRTV